MDWVGGFGQMIMFDYGLGGWVWQDDYVIIAKKKMLFHRKGSSRFFALKKVKCCDKQE